MSYEQAPATALLATSCICCGRPLLDAFSVESGIGPVCREKHGYTVDLPDDSRIRANQLVHDAAARAGDGTDPAFALQAAAEIEALGMSLLATKIRERFCPIRISIAEDGSLKVVTPFSYAFVDAIKNLPRPTRRFNKDAKCWEVAPANRRDLYRALSLSFPGVRAVGPKGVFQIPAADGRTF